MLKQMTLSFFLGGQSVLDELKLMTVGKAFYPTLCLHEDKMGSNLVESLKPEEFLVRV